MRLRRSSAERITKFSRSLVFEVLVGDREAGRAELAMSARFVAGCDAGDFERNDLVVEQSHDPADGADEAGAAFAGPEHAFSGTAF